MASTRGILLVGGNGTRLYPMTAVVSKQLQPVYDKPMVYYPLSTLMRAGITDVLVIATQRDLPLFEQLLGDGSRFGISLSYTVQQSPRGIAEGFVIAERTWGARRVAMILGDNLFHGESDLFRDAINAQQPATIFGYPVHDPSRYGVVELDGAGAVLSIQEKPLNPASSLAIPGLYIYDEHVGSIARDLKPSARGELEITDIHLKYLAEGGLRVLSMDRGITWLDTGTPESLLEATTFIHAIERRQGLKVACLEETALNMGYLSPEDFRLSIEQQPPSAYRTYCMSLIDL